MPDLDALVVAFQTQLSDVMEAVVKTAMFEVTRLVEDVFLVEVKRRRQELEALRMQLQRAEERPENRAGSSAVEQGADSAAAGELQERKGSLCGSTEQSRPSFPDVMPGCDVTAQLWMSRLKLDTEDEPAAAPNPEPSSQAAKQEDQKSTLDVKEEEVNAPCCSSHDWSSTFGETTGHESNNASEAAEVRSNKAEGDAESAAYQYPEDLADQPRFPPLDLDPVWIGLPGMLQSHRAQKECDPVKSQSSAAHEEPEPCDSVRSDLQLSLGTDHVSGSPKARIQPGGGLGVTVKTEAPIHSEKKHKKPGTASPATAVKPHRVIMEKFSSSHNKASRLEVLKPRAKVGLSLHEATEHVHPPLKKTPNLRTSTPASAAHSHSSRIPSTSKAAPPPALSVQRLHLNRTGPSWVGLKSQLQPAHCHHSNPAPHAEAHPHVGSRHLLRCGHCGKCFPHPSNLKAHLQTHTGERPFCCSLCGRSFTKLSNLKAHRRVHTGERPYCCLACGKRFTQKCNLKRHQRIHLDV